MKLLALLCLVSLTGCSASQSEVKSQRFVLVPDPSGISKDIPVGALAMDTESGQLCYTFNLANTSAAPSIKTCSALLKEHSSSK